jgi:hypothetical protein
MAGESENCTIFDSYFPSKYSDSEVAFVGRYWNMPEADKLYGPDEFAKSNMRRGKTVVIVALGPIVS